MNSYTVTRYVTVTECQSVEAESKDEARKKAFANREGWEEVESDLQDDYTEED